MTTSIVGVFADKQAVESAFQALIHAGVDSSDIGMVSGAPQGEQSMGADDAAGTAAVGTLAAIGGIAPVVLPWVGLVITAASAAGIAGVAAASGSDDAKRIEHIEDVLHQIGLQDVQARAYAQRLMEGFSILSVRTADDQVNQVADIIHQHGGTGVDYRPDAGLTLPS